MGMLFINTKNNSKFYINNRGWRRIFRLAIMFDWKPQGTQAPAEWNYLKKWDSMDYFTNESQVVTGIDAYDLAEAVDWAIHLLKEDAYKKPIEEVIGPDWEDEMVRRWRAALSYDLKDPGFIFFDLGSRNILTEFVEFCKGGEFRIY